MKIRATVTIEVDPAEWAEASGTGNTAAAVRRDVLRYIDYSLSQSPMLSEDTDATVTVR